MHFFTGLGTVNMNNLALGLCLGFALPALGGGAIYWARTLMTDVDLVQERHPMKSDPESTAFAVSEFKQGVADSGFTKYPLIRRTLLTAMMVLPLPARVAAARPRPAAGDTLRHTAVGRRGEEAGQPEHRPAAEGLRTSRSARWRWPNPAALTDGPRTGSTTWPSPRCWSSGCRRRP